MKKISRTIEMINVDVKLWNKNNSEVESKNISVPALEKTIEKCLESVGIINDNTILLEYSGIHYYQEIYAMSVDTFIRNAYIEKVGGVSC